jgi:carbonic anhydrase
MVYPKTKEFQKSLTPDKVIEMLKEGNKRFLDKKNSNREYQAEIKTTAQSPAPWAIIHRCMDSRVLPEIIFDAGVGEVFVTGVAGNVINDDITGSMEFPE